MYFEGVLWLRLLVVLIVVCLKVEKEGMSGMKPAQNGGENCCEGIVFVRGCLAPVDEV